MHEQGRDGRSSEQTACEVVNRVYNNVEFYRKKMQDMGIEPGDIKSIEDIGKLPFTTKEDLRENYPFGLLAITEKGCCPLCREHPVQQEN